ncbi:glucan biosynthesis protein G [Novosphingobium sp. Rr 2-17]|nr:glucan biosynthesis protein G [Novosphingobium sp. Rr 2-17]
MDAQISRRMVVRLFAALGVAGAIPLDRALAKAPQRMGPPTPFSWDILVERARVLAARPYVVPPVSAHAARDYDAAVKLTYGSAQAIAGNVRLLPASKVNATSPVRIAVVQAGQAREITDMAGLFAGGGTADASGFRVLDASGKSDWLAFQGASYFRACGSRDQYGLSARAVAIDTGLPSPEEFPNFTHFWFEQEGPGKVRIHALLDGPSVTGAFGFDCNFDDAGVIQDVTGTLFLRNDVGQLGIAAASSMFWYDQSRRPPHADWRPEIHDSDGLAIQAGNGERVWRPLDNPKSTRLHAFRADNPRGFGLLQRDQVFDHYQDDGVFYDKRPSLWVQPKGDWGPGSVYLLEMATDRETNDNIAVFWHSDRPAKAGERRDFAYRLTWTSNDPTADATARCVDSFEGPGGIPGADPIVGARKFVFDFAGASLTGLDRNSGVIAATDLPANALVSSAAYPIARGDGRWRVTLDVRTANLPRPEFRLFLKRGQSALSETVIKAIEV